MTDTKKESYLATIALLSIFFNESQNVRGSWEYDTDPAPKFKADASGAKSGLYEQIESAGGIHTPLWVSKLTTSRQKDIYKKVGVWYDYVDIRGHRRGRILKRLAALNPGVDGKPGKYDLVQVQIYEGLTEAEEIQLMVDQIGVKGLSDWGMYLACKRLSLTGLTENEIAVKVGKSRGYVQDKLRVAKLPPYVETEFRNRAEDKPAANLTRENLIELYRIQGEENIVDGPIFQEAYAKLTKTGAVVPPPPKAKSRTDLKDACLLIKDSIMCACLNWAAGDNIDLTSTLHDVNTLREKSLAWDSYLEAKNAIITSLPTAPTVEATVATVEATAPTVEATAPTVEATAPTVEATVATVEATAPTVEATVATVPFEAEPKNVPFRKGNGRKGNGKRN